MTLELEQRVTADDHPVGESALGRQLGRDRRSLGLGQLRRQFPHRRCLELVLGDVGDDHLWGETCCLESFESGGGGRGQNQFHFACLSVPRRDGA